jgi:hypothetical protein
MSRSSSGVHLVCPQCNWCAPRRPRLTNSSAKATDLSTASNVSSGPGARRRCPVASLPSAGDRRTTQPLQSRPSPARRGSRRDLSARLVTADYNPSTVPEECTHQTWIPAPSREDWVSSKRVLYLWKSGRAITLRYSGWRLRRRIAATTAWLYQCPAWVLG